MKRNVKTARVAAHNRDKAPKARRPTARTSSPITANNSPTVLVVDDDPSVLNALARLIRTAGFKVGTFDRPAALLADVLPTSNACLVIDVNLPEMNGVELCQTLVDSGRALPAILITARNDAFTHRLVEKAHTVAVLFKPIDEFALLGAITRAVAQSLSRPE